MAWIERADFRGRIFKTWQDTLTGKFRTRFHSGTVLHYGAENSEVDFSPVRINNAAFDGWRIDASPWVYELGKDLENHGDEDGWVSFGMRAADRVRRFKFRLVRACWYYPPTQAVSFIGAAANYNRANLSAQTIPLDISPEQNGSETLNAQSVAVWSNVLSGVNVSWRSEGRGLKEEITVSAVTRAAIPAPPTPANQTYFSFAFRIDAADVPRYIKNAILQSIESMDDADGRIELWDAAEKLLAFMPVDYAWSASNPEVKIRLRKRIFHHTDGNYYLLVGALASELASLPDGAIVFDPTFTDGYGGDVDTSFDTVIRSDVTTRNGGAATQATGSIYKILTRFALGGLTGTCNSATLYQYQSSTIGSSGAFSLTQFEILAANGGWIEGTKFASTADAGEPCWDAKEADGSGGVTTAWAGSAGLSTGGTDYNSTSLGTVAGNRMDANGTEYASSLTTSVIEAWFGSDPNPGILTTISATCGGIATSDNGTTGYRPKLVVDYTAGGGGLSIPIVQNYYRRRRIN